MSRAAQAKITWRHRGGPEPADPRLHRVGVLSCKPSSGSFLPCRSGSIALVCSPRRRQHRRRCVGQLAGCVHVCTGSPSVACRVGLNTPGNTIVHPVGKQAVASTDPVDNTSRRRVVLHLLASCIACLPGLLHAAALPHPPRLA